MRPIHQGLPATGLLEARLLGAYRPPAYIRPDAGWSSPVARQAHNLKVAGSNPAPATNLTCTSRSAYTRPFGRALPLAPKARMAARSPPHPDRPPSATSTIAGFVRFGLTSPYPGFRFPKAIIQHAIWLYLRSTLSLRDVEELLAAAGGERQAALAAHPPADRLVRPSGRTRDPIAAPPTSSSPPSLRMARATSPHDDAGTPSAATRAVPPKVR